MTSPLTATKPRSASPIQNAWREQSPLAMGLEDFERELAAGKESRPKREDSDRSKHRDDRSHRHKHRHHHRSRHEDDGHRRKRSRDRSHRDHEREGTHRSKRVKSDTLDLASNTNDADEWIEKDNATVPATEDVLDGRTETTGETQQRASWMQAPSSLDVDYLQQSRRQKSPPSQFVTAKGEHEKKIHAQELEKLMKDLEDDDDGEDGVPVNDEPAQHDVPYTFGDSGSQWRMTKLKAAYRQAKEENRPIDEVALDRYGDLRDFDDAREEERELDRRDRYGKDYVGLEKPSGELFQERKLAAGIRASRQEKSFEKKRLSPSQGEEYAAEAPSIVTVLDQTALNKLKAKMMKAKLRKDPSAAALEAEYNTALAASSSGGQTDTIVLSSMDNRMLAGGRSGEVNAVTNKRGLERGTVTENSDMSIADMVRHERRTRNTSHANEGLLLANRIAKDGKFTNDLEYMNDNAEKLASRDVKSDAALRSSAVTDFRRTQRILDSCPLCHHEDRNEPPTAPIISLGTRTFLTLCTEPELVQHGTAIVPVQHRGNLLECDDDEWEELRNFQKSLTRFYASLDRGVVFYENAAERGGRRHAALVAVPLRWDLVDAAPGFFKEAILAADEEWSQHRKIVDTAKGAREKYGKSAFRKMMVKEMPYFHVWFGMDGGVGHVVEDERRWPKGDLFAREVIGGMVDKGPEVVKRQGRWVRRDHRLDGFRKKWDKFDWTKVLMDGNA